MTGTPSGDAGSSHDGLILFVNGTLMRGLALHGNLAGAEFLGEAWTALTHRAAVRRGCSLHR